MTHQALRSVSRWLYFMFLVTIIFLAGHIDSFPYVTRTKCTRFTLTPCNTNNKQHSPSASLPKNIHQLMNRYCCGWYQKHYESSRKEIITTTLSSSSLSLSRGGGGGVDDNSNTIEVNPTASSISSSSSSSMNVSSYNLVWSPGFLKRFILSTLFFTFFHFILNGPFHVDKFISKTLILLQQKQDVHSSFSSSPLMSFISLNILLPLLSSACCLLQVIINILVGTGGCAGFNTILGPYRPYLLSLLLYLTIPKKLGGSGNSISSISHNWKIFILRFSISLMPELLHFLNVYLRKKFRNDHHQSQQKNQQHQLLLLPQQQDLFKANIEITIPTMGCVACINKIDSSIRQCDTSSSNKFSIHDVSSWIVQEEEEKEDNNSSTTSTTNSDNKNTNKKKGGGRARVQVLTTSKEELNSVSKMILKSIENAGFGKGCSIDTIVYD